MDPVPAAWAEPPGIGLGQDMGISGEIRFAASGAQWVSNHMTDWLHRPQASGNWFVPIYQRMMTIGAVLLLPFLLLAIVDAVRFRDLDMLVRAVAVWLPLAVLLTISGPVERSSPRAEGAWRWPRRDPRGRVALTSCPSLSSDEGVHVHLGHPAQIVDHVRDLDHPSG